MSNKLKGILCIIVFMVVLIVITPKSQAAGIVIAFSKSTANVGDTVTVTVTGSGVAGKVNLSVSGNATLSQNSVFVDNNSASVTATINGEGSIKITATPGDMAYSDTAAPYTGNPTAGTITVASNANSGSTSQGSNSGTSSNNTTTKSSNANLANLGITPNDFSGFTPSKTSYSVTVPNNVSSIQIYANKGQSGQTISGTGTKKLNEGANSFNVIVTAEDGKTTKTYTLTVNREKAEDKQETDEKEEENVDNTENGTDQNDSQKEQIFGLSELKIDGIELSPEFKSDVYEYTAKLVGEKDKLDITTKATEENAKVEITGNENLVEGENIVTILVTNEAGDKSSAYQIKVTKTLVDEEALAKEKELQEQEKMRKIIIGSCALAFIVLVIIILIWRHRRNKRLAEEFSIPYQGFNDDDYENIDYNKGNGFEKISDKFDNDIENVVNEEDKYENSNDWYNKDLSKSENTLEQNIDNKEELRKQYLNQSFDNEIDFDAKPRKRHSKGKRFK